MTYYGIWRHSTCDGPARLEIGLQPPSSMLSGVGDAVAQFDFVLSEDKSCLVNDYRRGNHSSLCSSMAGAHKGDQLDDRCAGNRRNGSSHQ
jgi:hypothetical protein